MCVKILNDTHRETEGVINFIEEGSVGEGLMYHQFESPSIMIYINHVQLGDKIGEMYHM